MGGQGCRGDRHHIEKLTALGIPRPSTAPHYYRVAAKTRTQDTCLTVRGPDSSGEIEPVIVAMVDGLWVGIGSDHTDRKAQALGIARDLRAESTKDPVTAVRC
nr:DUF2848 family protein [Bradyrhizobium manausense]